MPIQKNSTYFFLSERSAVFTLCNAQLEQLKVKALCMINSKTLHRRFLSPELKLHEELTCFGKFSISNILHMNAYNLNTVHHGAPPTMGHPQGNFQDNRHNCMIFTLLFSAF